MEINSVFDINMNIKKTSALEKFINPDNFEIEATTVYENGIVSKYFTLIIVLKIQTLSIFKKQSTLVISTSLISNSRLSRSENLVPVLTQRSTNRHQNIVEKRRNFSPFPQYFQYTSNLGVKLHMHSVKGGFSIDCFP